MNVVIDEKIPYLKDALEAMGHSVLAKPGVDICAGDVADAEALFVRTRTRCDASLLDGSSVRFIGTATIGYDHIDACYCAANSIEWTSAAGCNSGAVLQYVQSVVYAWSRERGVPVEGLSLGIVGAGEIGTKVALWARRAGMRVLLNDPPRAQREGAGGFFSLECVAGECDIITFHPTLVRNGNFPSYHLADAAFFASLAKCRLLINASRGPVFDNDALLAAMEKGMAADVVLDVWEHEPRLNLPLLNKVYIGTPHIAGYSAEGKMNATRIVLEAFARFTNYAGTLPLPIMPSPDPDTVVARSFADAALQIYSPQRDSAALKAEPAMFEELRNNYRLRREPSSYKLHLEK